MLALALAGCGSGVPVGGVGKTLTIYTDLPFDGPQKDLMQSIEDGELLALQEADYRAHGYQIDPAFPNDGNTSGWDPADTAAQATNATQDGSAIAYIGDFDSGATATSLPITNGADLLQVSPASPYVGLTDPSVYDDKGEPGSYYPAGGTQTFARLVPSDLQEAKATVEFMRWLGVKRLFAVTDTAPYASYDNVIATMVENDARQAGITIAGSAPVNTASASPSGGYYSLAQAITASDADAVIVGAAPDAGAEALWQVLFDQLRNVKLFAPSTLATNPFLNSLGSAAAATYITSPILPLSQYGPQAQRQLRLYRRIYGTHPTPWSLYGYEAMASVLKAIDRARNPANRLDVVRAYFHLGYRESVLGGYTIDAHGDTSRSRFVGYRVKATSASTWRLVELRKHLNGGA